MKFPQNYIGKIVLFIIGTVWLISDVYDNIMSNFLLTDKEVAKWGTAGDYGVALISSAFILGGWYLNTIFNRLKK